MGTNYDLRAQTTPWGEVPTLHIGKSSFGWQFLFRAYDQQPVGKDGRPHLMTKYEWAKFLDEVVTNGDCWIADEYGEPISVDDFFTFVERKQRDPENRSNADFTDIDGYGFSLREFC